MDSTQLFVATPPPPPVALRRHPQHFLLFTTFPLQQASFSVMPLHKGPGLPSLFSTPYWGYFFRILSLPRSGPIKPFATVGLCLSFTPSCFSQPFCLSPLFPFPCLSADVLSIRLSTLPAQCPVPPPAAFYLTLHIKQLTPPPIEPPLVLISRHGLPTFLFLTF